MSIRPSNEDPELDDILSQIMRPGAATPIAPPTAHKPHVEEDRKPKRPKPSVANGLESRHRSIFDSPARAEAPAEQPTLPPTHSKPNKKPQTSNPPKDRRVHPLAILGITLLLLIVGSIGGYFLYKGPVSDLVSPSPFSQQLKSATTYSLYYPAQLPPGYSIDKSTLNAPTGNVVVYSITNGTHNIAVTIQAKPAGLDLSKLLATYTDVGHVQTPAGKAYIGIQSKKDLVAHVITPSGWIIFVTDANTMPRSNFETIIRSLKQG